MLRFSPSNWEREILNQWDSLRYFPPIPPADFGYARAKLTVFRSSKEWLTTFEVIGYDSEAGECINQLNAHGSRLSSKRRAMFFTVVEPARKSRHYPYFDEDEAGNILLDPLDFTVVINEQEYHFVLSTEDFLKLGIDVKQKSAGEIDAIVKILRWLCYEHPEKVFFPPLRILQELGVPQTLPVFLQTYDWQHPDFRRREKPSDSVCLQNLAKAIAQNDRELYKCPEELANTHWSFWPEWPA
jgi:hypothetical protein